MKNIVLAFMLSGTLYSTALHAKPSGNTKEKVKPSFVPSYNQLGRDDYVYDPYYRDAETIKRQEEERKALKLKKEKMEALEKERKAKNKATQKILQKKNKASYDKAMQEYENRRKNNKTHNSIIISDKPI